MKNNSVFDVICIGTALVDSIIRGFDPTPVSAAGYRAESGGLYVGGEAVNVSVACAKLGLRAGILCALGRDAAGDLVEQTLRGSGVDTGGVVRVEGHSTPVTTMFVRDDGTRRSITNGAHRCNFHPERFAEKFLCARAVALGSLFRAPFDDPAVVHSVLSAARDASILTVADTKLPNFRVLRLDDLADSLPLIDYITPNEDEARWCTGMDRPEEMAEEFLRRGVGNVIIKRGARGCYFQNAARSLSLPACDIRAVDACGAGDNFLAGFLSGLLRGAPVEDALRFANACGGICASAVGACAGLRDRAQVLEFLRRTALEESP